MVEITRIQTSETNDPQLQAIRQDMLGAGDVVSLFDDDDAETSDILDVMGATWMNETLIGQSIDAVRQIRDARGSRIDPGFNPYKFYEANKQNFPHLTEDDVYGSGFFDRAVSEDSFYSIVNQLDREKERGQTLANSGLGGMIAGFAAANADVLTLVPGASVVRGGSALRAGVSGAAIATGLNMGVEATGQAVQLTREQEGIAMIAGLSAAFGGGLGVASQLLYNRRLAKDVGDAILGDDAQPVEIPAGVDRVSSVGAAQVQTPETIWENIGPIARTVGRLQYNIPLFRSPASVAQAAESNEARFAFDRIFDSGLSTGKVQRVRAEEIQREIVREKDATLYRSAEILRRAQAQHDDVNVDTFNRELYKVMVLGDEYVPNVPYADFIKQAAGEMSNFYRGIAKRGVSAGIFREEQIMEDYAPQSWVRHMILQDTEGFRELLLRNYEVGMDDAWLRDRYNLSVDQYNKLDLEDPQNAALKARIDEEWSVAHQEVVADRLDASVQRMEAELKELRRELAVVSRAYRSADTADTKQLERVSETFGRQFESYMRWRTAKFDEVQAEQQLLTRASEAMRQAQLARMQALVEPPKEDTLTYRAWQDWKKAEERLLNTIDGKKTPDNEKLQKILDQYEAAKVKFEERLGRPVVAAEDPRMVVDADDPATAYLRGRVKELDAQLAQMTKRMEQAQARHAMWADRWQKAEAKKAEIEQTKAMAQAARERLTETAKNLRKAIKDEKNQLRNARAFTPNKQYVNELVDALTGREMMPSGMMIDMAGETTARAKFRKIKIRPELLDEMIERGFLNTNLTSLSNAYARDVGGRIGLSEVFQGDHTLKTTRDKVRADYDRKIKEARQAGDQKRVDMLSRQRDIVDKTLKEYREAMLGKYEFAQTDWGEAAMWFGRTARNWNGLRYLGLSTLASLPDLASVALQNGVLKTVPKAFGRNIAKVAEQMSDRELAIILHATENIPVSKMSIGGLGFQGSRFMEGDMAMQFGVGTGTTRKVTGAVDAAGTWAMDKLMTWNLNRFWNGRLKFVAAHGAMHGLLEAGETLAKGGRLSKKQVKDAAFLGLDERDLRRFYELTQQHGEEVISGFKLPIPDRWGDTREGAEMRRRFYTAVQRVADRAITTPTLGDTPLFMSSTIGKLLMQFQSFGFAFVNKFGRELDRRIVNGEAGEALMSMAWMSAMGITAYVLREGAVRGEMFNPETREEFFSNLQNPGFVAKEIVDRGGMLFFMSPYFDSALKLAHIHGDNLGFGGALEASGLVSTRFKDRAWFTSLFGPLPALGEDINRLGGSTNLEQLGRNVDRLMPFGNLLWVEGLQRNVAPLLSE